MGTFTHLLTCDGGVLVTQLGATSDISVFSNPLHHFDGEDQWGLGLARLPAGTTYDQMLEAGELPAEYIQAGGTSEAMTVEIRKPGGRQWGVQWVRYTVGHPPGGREPLEISINVAGGIKMIGRSEVFEADETTQMFWDYYRTARIPDAYVLRPMAGYTVDGASFDLTGIAG